MRIILLTDVPKVGNRYDIKDLKDGFAQNVLIARGLAVLATPKALADLNKKKKEISIKKDEKLNIFNSLINNIKSKKILIKVKANEKGHLFKSIGPKDVVSAVFDTLGLELEEGFIVMENIKELGVYNIKIKKGNIEGFFEIEIDKEKP